MRISDWSSDVCSSDLRGRGYCESLSIRESKRWGPASECQPPRDRLFGVGVILVRVVRFIFSVGIAFNLGKNVIQVKVAVIVDAEAAVRIAIGPCIVKACRVERGGIAFLVLLLRRKHQERRVGQVGVSRSKTR